METSQHLFKELESIEQEYPELVEKDSPTQRVGANPIDNFKTDKKENLDVSMKHLKPCNFFNYQLIPNEPALVFDDCNV